MDEKNILLFEKYDGVRFVLERSLVGHKEDIILYSSHLKNEIKTLIEENHVDLLITELSKYNPDGLEISFFARKLDPQIEIFWITVMGCHLFREQKNELGNVKCIEKPLEINQIRNNVFQALKITQ